MTGRDAVYYQATEGNGLAQRLALVARRDIYARFIAAVAPKPGDRLLDIGTSDVIDAIANPLEMFYPHRGDITCASLSDGVAIRAAYPEVNHVTLAGDGKLPFPDDSFHAVFCNAVLEHVGTDADRRRLLGEALRVASIAVFAIPNRWFPVEHHSGAPLLHYFPPLFRAVMRARGQSHWADPMQLDFMDRAKLKTLWPATARVDVAGAGVLAWSPFASNLVAVGRR